MEVEGRGKGSSKRDEGMEIGGSIIGKYFRAPREGGEAWNEEGRRKGSSEGEKVSGGRGDHSW